ncbi:transcription factor SOX4 (SOX group C) [Sarotherodon galilaeus]
MDAFNAKDMAMKAQKKILSSMATKSSVQMFIDDTTSEILDELYRVSRDYLGNKSEAQKVIKDLIKIAVKIGVLFRNNRFSTEELAVDFTFEKTVMADILTSCRDLLLKLVNTHLTTKSHGRINHVFNHYSDPQLLTQLYNPDGPFRPNLTKICKGLNKLVEDGTI